MEVCYAADFHPRKLLMASKTLPFKKHFTVLFNVILSFFRNVRSIPIFHIVSELQDLNDPHWLGAEKGLQYGSFSGLVVDKIQLSICYLQNFEKKMYVDRCSESYKSIHNKHQLFWHFQFGQLRLYCHQHTFWIKINNQESDNVQFWGVWVTEKNVVTAVPQRSIKVLHQT